MEVGILFSNGVPHGGFAVDTLGDPAIPMQVVFQISPTMFRMASRSGVVGAGRLIAKHSTCQAVAEDLFA